MPRARLRQATLDDLATLVRQRRRMFEHMGATDAALLDEADRLYRRWARARLKSGKLVGFLVEERGEAVAGGCVWLQPVQPRPHALVTEQPYILSMFTEPAHRGKGHASRIVRAAVQWARERGYPRISLHASEEGRSVYERLGFEPTTEMRLKLDAPRRRRG